MFSNTIRPVRSLVLFSALIFPLGIGGQNPPSPFTTVCDLMRSPAKYNGKIITLRGDIFHGGHGDYLHGDACDGVLVTNGHEWASIVSLVASDAEYVKHGLDFKRSTAASNQIAAAILREGRRTGRAGEPKVTVTLTGLIETRYSFDGQNKQDASEWGFGPGAAAPAQLFVDSAKDIVVEFETRVPSK